MPFLQLMLLRAFLTNVSIRRDKLPTLCQVVHTPLSHSLESVTVTNSEAHTVCRSE